MALSASFNVASAQGYSRSTRFSEDEIGRLRITVEGGYGYRTAKISPSVPDAFVNHSKKLRNGYFFSADASWYPESAGFGAGLRVQNFHSFHEEKIASVGVDDDIQITYFGPQLSSRYIMGRSSLVLAITAGYLNYFNRGYDGVDYFRSGKTLGYGANFSYDFAITSRFGVGVSLSGISGTLRKMRKGDNGQSKSTQDVELEKGDYESLAHIGASAGIRFTL